MGFPGCRLPLGASTLGWHVQINMTTDEIVAAERSVEPAGVSHVKAAPERMVKGSNWPHPNESVKPDDSALFDLMAQLAPDPKTRHRNLVVDPEALYGFTKS